MTPVVSAVNVVIFADAALPRLAWEALLSPQPSLDIFGTVANLEGLLVCASSAGQTAVLLELREALLEQVTQIAKSLPNVGLLCLVDVYDLDQIVALLQAGAAGVLSRHATLPELSRSLIAASRGEIVLPPELAAPTLAALARGKLTRQQNIDALTERERDVLTRLAQGMTNKEIAQTLFLSVRTVEAHLHNVYGKLNVASRTEAVLWAVQHGLEP